VILDLDLDAPDVPGPLTVLEHLVPGGFDVDEQVVDRSLVAEHVEQPSGIDRIDPQRCGRDGIDLQRHGSAAAAVR